MNEPRTAYGLSPFSTLYVELITVSIPAHYCSAPVPLSPSSDPQQRLLLEAFAKVRAADTLFAASADQRSLPVPTTPQGATTASSAVGVYVGVSQLEYARLTLEQAVPVNAYYATGMPF